MAKRPSTIHVENFVWNEIERIQKEQDITSRNTAIEYLVAEYRGLKLQLGKSNIVIDVNENFEKETKIEENSKKKDDFDVALKNLEDGMAD